MITFEEIILYTTFLALIPLIILSIYWIRKKEYLSLLLRHLAGFSIGFLDQFIMILFGWHSSIIPIVIPFDYELYGIWFLIMPLWKEIKNKKIWMPIWIIFSGLGNTLLENLVRIYSYGNLNYPTGWTLSHTIIFYLIMHLLGTLIVSLNLILKPKILKDAYLL